MFEVAGAKIIPVDKARFVLTRIPSNTVALDTTMSVSAGQDSIDLDLRVVVLSANEQFNLSIALIGPAGDTVFRGGPLTVISNTGSGGAPQPVAVPLSYTGVGSNAASVKFVTHDTSLLGGDTVAMIAQALDKAGVPIANTPILLTSLDTTKLTVPVVTANKVVGRPARGLTLVQALLLTGQADTARLKLQPVPSAIAGDSGNTQTGTVAAALANAVVARVIAADNLGVSGVWVNFATPLPGSIKPDSSLTDSLGRARAVWTISTAAGAQAASATTPKLASAVAAFSATGVAGPVDSLATSAGAVQSAVAGAAVATPPAVTVKDHYGNPIAGATVQFLVTAGGGTLAGATPLTNASGLAAVTSWTLGTAVGANTLVARIPHPHPPAPLDTLVATFSAGATTAPAAAIALNGGQSQSDTIGAPLATPLSVKIADQFGNPVQGAPVTFAITAGGGSLSSTTANSDASGIAQTNWTLGSTVGAAIVTASASGLTGSPVTFNATLLPGKAAALAFGPQPA
ncbi:MAG TPA: Ig-like domain-containing protein, partial [Gemmatimonadales bacterium]